MNLQTFFTLLVVGAAVGLVASFAGKNKTSGLPVNLVLGIAGAFIGWFVFTEVSHTALMVLFSIGGSLSLLWFVRALKK